MSSDARPRSVPRLAAARLRRFGRRLGRVRFSSFSLRSRLLCLAVALVVGGLAVSDGLVVAVVRGQLVDRVNTQLERFAKSASTRPPFPQHQAPAGWADGGDGRMSGLLSNYAIAYALPDGTHSAWQQQGLSTSDPSPSLPTMTPAQLTAHTGHIFNVSSNHGSANWQVLILPASYPLYVNGTPVAGSVVVAVSLVDTDATMTKLDEGFLAIGLVVLLLISVAGWFAVRTANQAAGADRDQGHRDRRRASAVQPDAGGLAPHRGGAAVQLAELDAGPDRGRVRGPRRLREPDAGLRRRRQP
jgi:two-component system OmpR family sensor kinase